MIAASTGMGVVDTAALRCCPYSVARDILGTPARNIAATEAAMRGLDPNIVRLPRKRPQPWPRCLSGGVIAATVIDSDYDLETASMASASVEVAFFLQ